MGTCLCLKALFYVSVIDPFFRSPKVFWKITLSFCLEPGLHDPPNAWTLLTPAAQCYVRRCRWSYLPFLSKFITLRKPGMKQWNNFGSQWHVQKGLSTTRNAGNAPNAILGRTKTRKAKPAVKPVQLVTPHIPRIHKVLENAILLKVGLIDLQGKHWRSTETQRSTER